MKTFKDHLNEGGLWDNIHAKRKRIKAGAKERMRKPGSKGSPSAQDFKNSQNEEKEKGVDGKACWKGYKRMGTKKKGGKTVDNCVPMEDVVGTAPMSGPTGIAFAMNIDEKLNADKDSIGTYVDDFKKSDAPQFKGADRSKRRSMAVAAYLKSKRRSGERAMGESIQYNSDMGVMDWGTPEGTDYMKDVTPGEKKKKLKSISIKESLPPHLQGLLDKKGNIDPKKVSKLVHKGKKTPSGSKITDVTPKGFGIRESGPAHETKAEYRKDNEEDAPVLGDYALTKQDIAELEHEADNITYDMAVEYGAFDDEDEDEPEVNIMEVLSVQGRLKRKFSARKNRQKLKVARGIALRRGSSPDRLKKRATRGARGAVYKRLLKGRDKSKLPPAEKGRLEKLIGMYAPLVSRLAVRMLPGMRKMEINRMKSRKGGGQKAKKYKAAKPMAKKQTAKKFKIKRK